jgi:hypothetical protein
MASEIAVKILTQRIAKLRREKLCVVFAQSLRANHRPGAVKPSGD